MRGVRIVGLLLISLAASQAHTEPDPKDLLKRAGQVALTNRLQAGKLIRQALSLWDASPDLKPPEYADAEVVLSLILLANPDEALKFGAPELIGKALDLYENASPPVSGNKLALALEIQASLLRLAHEDETARPIAERAQTFRKFIIEQMQNLPETPAPARNIGGPVSAPAIVSKVEPEYSAAARLAKHQGTSLLKVVVDPNGTARDIHLVKSLGFDLDEKAYEAVRQWRFRPSMKDGEPVAVYATIEVSFRLL